VIPRNYYLLAVSQELVRLYKVSNGAAERVRSLILPLNIYSALWMDEQERSMQHKTITQHGAGAGSMYHGFGDIKDHKKSRLRRFLNVIDRRVNKIIKDKNIPLIIACDKSLFPIYKRVSDYPQLEERFVRGNPDNLKRAELVQKVKDAFLAL
jgi:hypothetical protein